MLGELISMYKEVTDMGVYAPILPVAELKQLSFNPNDILVVKIDTDKYKLDEASEIYQEIVSQLPKGLNTIGIPAGIELDIQDIDWMIEELQRWKNEHLLH